MILEKKVVAETHVDNIASQRVFEKSGFQKYKTEDGSCWYHIVG